MASEPDGIADAIDEDELSVTSTLEGEENSDEEWTAERILAEGKLSDGETRWLVEWTGFPLAEATWEPKSHVKGLLLDGWKDTKLMQESGETQRFDLNLWFAAVDKNLRAKYARHEKRNQKRERLGLEPTTWVESPEELCQVNKEYYPTTETRDYQDSSGENSSEVDAGEESSEGDSSDGQDEELDCPSLDGRSPTTSKSRRRGTSTADVASSVPNKSEVDSRTSLHKDEEPPAGEKAPAESPARGHIATAPVKAAVKAPYQGPEPKSGPATASVKAPVKIPFRAPDPVPTPEISSSMQKSTGQPDKQKQQPKQAVALAPTVPPKDSSTVNKTTLTGLISRATGSVGKKGKTTLMNVFAGGATRKKRPTLLDAATDTTKEPKMVNHRKQRIMQQKQRDAENNAPANMPRHLISLDPKASEKNVPNMQETTKTRPTPRNEASKLPTHTSPTALSPTTDLADLADLTNQPATVVPGQNTTIVVDSEQKKPKRKKSVHWDDHVTYQEAPPEMELEPEPEPSLFCNESFSFNGSSDQSEDPQSPPDPELGPPKPPTPPRGSKPGPVFWVGNEEQTMTKRCFFGPKTSRFLDVEFQGLPKNTSHIWLEEFIKCQSVVFSRMCAARDFQFQGHRLRAHNLAAGSLACPINQDALKNVSSRLQLASRGIFSYSEKYCILAFPAACTEWNFEDVQRKRPDNILNFVIFEPAAHLYKESFVNPGPKDTVDIPRGLGQFLQLDYQKLVPESLRGKASHPIFLAFHPGGLEEARFMVQWLKISSAQELQFYTSATQGDWIKFCRVGQGIIIIHEDVVPQIRRFPNMASILPEAARSGGYAIWVFQRSSSKFYKFPTDLAESKLGDIGLHRIGPARRIFLMTPSFILSQPQEADLFMRWFREKCRTVGRDLNTLAVCANIADWVRELFTEHGQNTGRDRVHEADRQDFKAWVSLWEQLDDLELQHLSRGSPEDGFLLFAPENIDGNDEQSLVNWFGSWTLGHLDKAGRFYVIGSTSLRAYRMTKQVKRFKYASDVVNDVDIDRENVYKRLGLQNPQDHPENTQRNAPTGPRGHGPTLVENDSGSCISNYLYNLNLECTGRDHPIILYNRPVSYSNSDMAFRQGDIKGEFESFSNWFKFFNRLKCDYWYSKNTYMGFFYTLPEGDQSTTPKRGVSQPRRPWLAVFRAMAPHIKPWRATELFIWDPNYDQRFLGRRNINMNDLIGAQQSLIKLVDEMNEQRNPGLPLDQVWLGPGKNSNVSKHSQPLDMCLDTLGAFISNLKAWVPSPVEFIASRGWKPVDKPRAQPHPDAMDTDGGGPDLAKDEDQVEDEDTPGKIIFHPPSGDGMRHTLCRNLLYSEFTKRMDRGAEVIDFKFHPTKEWYGQQVREGRGFSHVMVEGYRKIFEVLEIDGVGDDRRKR